MLRKKEVTTMSNTPNQEPNLNSDPYASPAPSESYGSTPPQPPPNYPPQEQGNYGTPPPNYPPQGQGNYGTPLPNYLPQEPGNYGTPPPNYQQNVPTGYGTNYPPNMPPNYGYNPPPASTPLPLGTAIRQLPGQYIRVLTKPSAVTFAAEKGKAAWNVVWVQIALVTLVVVLLSYAFVGLTLAATLNAQNLPTSSVNVIKAAFGFVPLAYIILIPLGFFIGAGIYHLIAKAFGGEGTFLQYIYSYLLFSTPITILNFILILIPFLGSLASFALGIYGIVLQIFMTMGVHRLSGGRATLAVLILPIIGFVLGIVLFVVLIGVIAASLPRR